MKSHAKREEGERLGPGLGLDEKEEKSIREGWLHTRESVSPFKATLYGEQV